MAFVAVRSGFSVESVVSAKESHKHLWATVKSINEDRMNPPVVDTNLLRLV